MSESAVLEVPCDMEPESVPREFVLCRCSLINKVNQYTSPKTIPRDARELICKLYVFMKKEAIEGPILLKKVQERVAMAVGISRSSVQRILKERNKFNGMGLVETTVATTSTILNFCKSTVPLFSYVDVNAIKAFADPLSGSPEKKVAPPTLSQDSECGPSQEKIIKLELKDAEQDIGKAAAPSGILIKNEVFINDNFMDTSDIFHEEEASDLFQEEGECSTASQIPYSSKAEEEASSRARVSNSDGEKDIYFSKFGEFVVDSFKSLKHERCKKKLEQLIRKAIAEVTLEDQSS